jgi:hypothetical protein
MQHNQDSYSVFQSMLGLQQTNSCIFFRTGQSSWLQRSGFDSQHYQIFGEVVGLEQAPLSLRSTTEELLGRNSSGSGLEIREYGQQDPLR